MSGSNQDNLESLGGMLSEPLDSGDDLSDLEHLGGPDLIELPEIPEELIKRMEGSDRSSQLLAGIIYQTLSAVINGTDRALQFDRDIIVNAISGKASPIAGAAVQIWRRERKKDHIISVAAGMAGSGNTKAVIRAISQMTGFSDSIKAMSKVITPPPPRKRRFSKELVETEEARRLRYEEPKIHALALLLVLMGQTPEDYGDYQYELEDKVRSLRAPGRIGSIRRGGERAAQAALNTGAVLADKANLKSTARSLALAGETRLAREYRKILESNPQYLEFSRVDPLGYYAILTTALATVFLAEAQETFSNLGVKAVVDLQERITEIRGKVATYIEVLERIDQKYLPLQKGGKSGLRALANSGVRPLLVAEDEQTQAILMKERGIESVVVGDGKSRIGRRDHILEELEIVNRAAVASFSLALETTQYENELQRAIDEGLAVPFEAEALVAQYENIAAGILGLSRSVRGWMLVTYRIAAQLEKIMTARASKLDEQARIAVTVGIAEELSEFTREFNADMRKERAALEKRAQQLDHNMQAMVSAANLGVLRGLKDQIGENTPIISLDDLESSETNEGPPTQTRREPSTGDTTPVRRGETEEKKRRIIVPRKQQE